MFIIINKESKLKQHTGAFETRLQAYLRMLEYLEYDVQVDDNLQSYEIVEIDS